MAKLPTIKVVLINKNQLTLKVRIPGTNSYRYKSLDEKIDTKAWKKELRSYPDKHKDRERINRIIFNERDRIVKCFENFRDNDIPFTAANIEGALLGDTIAAGDFIAYYKSYVATLKDTKKVSQGYIDIWETEYKSLTLFAGNALPFKAVNKDFLNRYHKSLADHRNGNNEPYAPTTLFKKMRQLYRMVLKAIKEDLIDKKQIAGFEMVKYEEPDTNYLTLDQLRQIENKVYSGEYNYDISLKKTACFFLVECWGGIRISDWRSFKVETLIYERNFKVRANKNGEPIYLDLTVFKSLDRIVTYIAENGLKFDIADATANELLKQVGRDIKLTFGLTSHDGRRTFGTMLGELQYSTRFISDAMGISEETAKRYVKITKQSLSNEMALRGGL